MDNGIEVIARGILLRRGYILLSQSTRHGYWYLPGGHVEFGEPAADALQREFREECGVEIRPGDCVLITEVFFAAKRPHHELNIVFQVDEVGDTDAEVISREPGVTFGWFELAQVPEVDLRPASIKAWLAAGGRTDPAAKGCAWISEVPGY